MDLIELANAVKDIFPEDTIWGVLGESMGAATAMMAIPEIPWLSFGVEDAGYTDLHSEITAAIKYKAKLPEIPFTLVIAYYIKRFEYYSDDDVFPIDSVKKTDIPMLFIHGGQDQLVPTRNVYDLYEAKADKKMIHVFEDVPHAKSALMHQDEYTELIREFCTEFGIIGNFKTEIPESRFTDDYAAFLNRQEALNR